jgi:hypothetical protein
MSDGAEGDTMKKLSIACIFALICALQPLSASSRTLSGKLASDGVERVVIEISVGELELVAGDSESVTVKVELIPRRGGIFSSLRKAEEEVERATLEIDRGSDSLALKVVSADSADRRFEELWKIEVPAHLALALKHGVGEATIQGMTGGIEAAVGVCDLTIRVQSGDVMVEATSGDVKVLAPLAEYRAAECETGVGSTQLLVAGKAISSDGMIGSSTSWSDSDGVFKIEVEVGFGDVEIRLN